MAEKDTKTSDEKLDAIASHLDSLHKRMDSWDDERKSDKAKYDAACAKMDAAEEEKKKADSAKADAAEKDEEQKKADAATAEEKAKADAAAEEEKKKSDQAKADAARSDATSKENADLKSRIAILERHIPSVLKEEERPRFVAAQAKAETIYHAFGDSAGAPRWMNGEVFPDYQRRLLSRFQRYSPDWKEKDLAKVDASVLDIAEARIYQDAMQEARHPTDLPPNTLRKIERRDPHTDRKVTEFVGAEDAFWNQFKCYPNDIRAGRIKPAKSQSH